MSDEPIEDDKMTTACCWLRAEGVAFRKMTKYHLKLGSINFWPKTGTITVDGEPTRVPDKGLPALARLLGKTLHAVPTEQRSLSADDPPIR